MINPSTGYLTETRCHRRMWPRRLEDFGPQARAENVDRWREDDSCSYCGSLNPATFMARIEAGDVILGPTDKNYKVYVQNAGGASFGMTYRQCPKDAACTGPDDCTHWTTEPREGTKFYFQHLSVDQRKRFVELLNEKKLRLDYPGHFYRLPFFCTKVGT
jgi:hypothetical protein